MSDPIDRQAAIDALGEKPLAWTKGEYEQGLQDQWERDVDALIELPSLQPREDIRAICGECDAWNQYKNYPQPGWTPVTERMPDEKDAGILKKFGTKKRSDYVLATVEVKGERMTVTACTYDGEWDWNMKYAFPDYKIVAWMPLPEPFKEK